MPLINRDSFLAAAGSPPFVDVSVPELGEGATVRLRVMSGAERDEWDRELTKRKPDFIGIRGILIRLTAIDESGNNLFTPEDEPTLEKNHIIRDKLFSASFDLNCLGEKKIEEAAKN